MENFKLHLKRSILVCYYLVTDFVKLCEFMKVFNSTKNKLYESINATFYCLLFDKFEI